MTCKYGDPLDTVVHRMQGWLVTSGYNFRTVWSRLLSGGALDCYSYSCVLYPQVHGDGSIEFGGLNELADAADNYHNNINKLYGNFDEFTLTVKKVMRNIVVSMYAHYIDLWSINGACVGHHALLMRLMLEFTFIYGRYCRREWQLKHFNPPVDDPRLSIKALMKSDETEICRADMFRMFKTGMDIMGDADSTLYAEPT